MKRLSGYIALAVAMLFFAGCSTQKNTPMSRFYHATLTRYNPYFNGKQAYIEGYQAQEKAATDNYLEILDLFPISNEAARKTGTANFDKAIEKAQKCVTLHSIKKKPVKKQGATMSDKDKEFYNKNEYNPFLWHAWMLMADSQMQKGEFLEAASTYSYICRLYQDAPSIVSEARMKMAQCYSELEWNYEAEEVFSRLSLDSIPVTQKAQLSAIKASHLLKQKRYPESLRLLRQALPSQRISKTQRIREHYLLGQLYKEEGDMNAAYNSFRKVLRMNPPYKIDFNARIMQTECMPASEAARIEKKLRRMARNPSNKDYLDQVYYAIGNVSLACGDTAKALQAYETGLVEGKQRRPERGVLLLTMATIYWNQAKYADASRCYSEAVGLVEEDNPKYDELMLRSSVLGNLLVYTNEIELQDSLRHLATLPDTVVYGIVDRIIEKLLEEEAEAERLAKLEEKEAALADDMAQTSIVANDGSWYFYNQALVKEGAAKFNKTWGRRKLEDHWRRQDKSASLAEYEEETEEDSQEITAGDDSLEQHLPQSDSIGAGSVYSDDPHTREYYIQQIPYTGEQMRESSELLADALFNAGVIYKDDLTEYGLAEKSLRRSSEEFPDLEKADDAVYNLYLLYSLWGKPEMADECKDILRDRYPDSRFTLIVTDPEFEENVRYGKHREDSLYQAAYSSYLNGEKAALMECCRLSEQKYPVGQHRAKFMFLEATARLSDGDTQGFLGILKEIVEKYPDQEISQLAGIISKGVLDGRILQSTTFGNLWSRRNGMEIDSLQTDSLRPEFNPERQQPFIVVMTYPQDSLSENQLLFETARYNFSRYMVRNFDMAFRHEYGIGMLIISEFLNFDEAYLYRKRLYAEGDMASRLEGINTLIITKENLELLLKYYSFDEYTDFYNAHFLNIPEFDIDGLSIDEQIDGDEDIEQYE